MEEINNTDWHARFKAMKKGMKLTNADIAEITGNTSDSVKNATQPNKELPRSLRLAVVIFERLNNKVQN